MVFTAMVFAHRARVSCKRSQADTALQCYAFLLRMRVHVHKRERCSEFGLDPSRCGNGHGGTGVRTVVSREGCDRCGSPWACGRRMAVQW
jgi:hypothetical protein